MKKFVFAETDFGGLLQKKKNMWGGGREELDEEGIVLLLIKILPGFNLGKGSKKY